MTKGLTATLAIAILFLVSTLMEEGGPLDNFAGKAGNANLATADTGSGEGQPSEVVLAQTQSPPPAPASSTDAWGWFNESAPTQSTATEPRAADRQQSPRQTNSRGHGALPRHRLNIEE